MRGRGQARIGPHSLLRPCCSLLQDMPVIPFALLSDRFGELDRNGDMALTLPELCVSLDLCTPDDVRPGVAISPFDRAVSTAAASTAPAQIHLGVGPSYSAMLVQWAQNTQANASVQWDVVSRAASGNYAFSAVVRIRHTRARLGSSEETRGRPGQRSVVSLSALCVCY